MRAAAQGSKGVIFFLKSNWEATNYENEAAYLMHITDENDTTHICMYYTLTGSMVKQESFYDADFTIPNGLFCWYNAKGVLDSVKWIYKRTIKTNNANSDIAYPKLEAYLEEKAGNNTSDRMHGNSENETANVPVNNMRESNSHAAFAVQTNKTTEIPAYFGKDENSTSAWQKYLQKNVASEVRFTKLYYQDTCCEVTACFTIQEDGSVGNIYMIKSCEWSADLEVINALRKSPAWHAATINDIPVKYKLKQHFSFCTSVH